MEAGSGCGAWLDKTWQPSLANERFPCREGESNSIKLFGLTYCNRQRNTLLPFISAYGQRNIDCWKSQHATTSSIFVFYCSEIVYHSLTQNEQHCEIVLQTYAMNKYIYIYNITYLLLLRLLPVLSGVVGLDSARRCTRASTRVFATTGSAGPCWANVCLSDSLVARKWRSLTIDLRGLKRLYKEL